jgi:hypothetical protein
MNHNDNHNHNQMDVFECDSIFYGVMKVLVSASNSTDFDV